jgi:hypothetical protein
VARGIGLIAEDQRTHLIADAPDGGAVAKCGRGAIVRRLPGRWRPGDRLNCPDCEALPKD